MLSLVEGDAMHNVEPLVGSCTERRRIEGRKEETGNGDVVKPRNELFPFLIPSGKFTAPPPRSFFIIHKTPRATHNYISQN